MKEKNYDSNNLIKDYNQIMKGFQNDNPLLNQEWVKKGDYYEQFSVYDDSLVTVSGILN